MSWVWIALGGAVGTVLRYGLSLLSGSVLGTGWPWGTFLANAIGSFALGVAMEVLAGREIFGTDARLVIGVGVLGGFTTYSSFNLETLRLFEQDMWGRALGYATATMLLCLAAGAAGLALARSLKT